MLELLSLEVEGFASIVDPVHIDLNKPGITIIRARNGSGKSNLISALVWGLYGKNLKGISDVNSWPNIVNKDYKGTKVVVNFRANGKIHKVIRCLNYKDQIDGAKGGNRLIYYIETEQIPDRGKTSIQALIDKNLGMGYNLFINSAVFGQGMTRLIQESGSDQKALFEQMFNLGYISSAKKLIMEKASKVSQDLDEKSSLKEKLEYKIKVLKSNIKSLRDEGDDKANELHSKIGSVKSRMESTKARLEALEEKAKTLKPQLKELDRLKALYESSRDSRDKAMELQNKSLLSLIDEILGLLKKGGLKKAISKLETYREAITNFGELNHQYDDSKSAYLNLKLKVEGDRDKISHIDHLKSDLEYMENELQTLMNTKISVSNVKTIRAIKADIKVLNDKLSAAIEDMGKVQIEYDNLEWANRVPFGNQGIKTFLFSSSMEVINKNLREYSEILGINIQFVVDLQSTKKDFVPQISFNGLDVDYKELSGGQKQLVNLAMAFAMNEALCEMKGISIAFLDEVFESLSSDNIEIVTELIKKIYKDKTLFLITHLESLPLSKFKVLRVDNVKGRSKYQWV